MTIEEVSRVCFVGAGTMGCFNSLLASAAGYESVVHDVSKTVLASFEERQSEMAAYLIDIGLFKARDLQGWRGLVSVSSDLKLAVKGADLVSESVAENLEIKKQVHGLLDSLCPASTLITTNTSKLLVSDIEGSLKHSERFAALHSHLGSFLIDIVGSRTMSPGSVDLLRRYVKSLNGVPLILKKENPGYVMNAILAPLLTTGMYLVITGKATIEDVDSTWMSECRATIGPFGMMDMFGINVVYEKWDAPREDLPAKYIQPQIKEYLAPYVEKGWLGIKSGKGFYDYPDPVYGDDVFLRDIADRTGVFEALLATFLVSAIDLVQNEVVDAQTVDRAWMMATGLEKGPFGWLDSIGIDRFLEIYARQRALGLSTDVQAQSVNGLLQTYIDSQELGEKSGKGFYNYPEPAYRASGFASSGV